MTLPEPLPALLPQPASAVVASEPADLVPEPPVAEPTEPTDSTGPIAKIRRASVKPSVSTETLAAWQASLAAAQAAKQRATRATQTARERAVLFRHLRAAVRQLANDQDAAEADAGVAPIRADRLAMAVHRAPEHTRVVIDALLRQLKRR